ncbi:NYN domain-containing protein [Cohnella pontilimi]|uniref:NYN domain-containing protein n=1 Tax=Cohnella pontilimi TaxID=2564100 RepID=A0A4U0F4P9_9BACL|nr:NYN domain-containing protein [Cohnella pontilimi]TJY39575.1 NYN domain-containing protein [Cohnella pontilimi]
MSDSEKKLAVLIDADNVPHKNIKGILKEITKYGSATFKRIYGDWTTQAMSGWKKKLLETAITPIQQYSYTTGKNSTDSALIIDAMDILYSGNVDGFCIVASDSDYTRLAVRIREAGLLVYGFGERKTPEAFRVSCDKFTYLEIIDSSDSPELTDTKATQQANSSESINPELIELISSSVEDVADENGWASLGAVGSHIQKKKPDFDPRNYGFSKLTPLITNLNVFEIDRRRSKGSKADVIYIKTKVKVKQKR